MGDLRFAIFMSLLLVLAGYALVARGGAWPTPAEPPRLVIDLTPEFGKDGAATGLGVHYRLSGMPLADKRAVRFVADDMLPFGRTTDRITQLLVSDSQGAIRLVPEDGGAAWRAARMPKGAMEVSYRIPVAMPRPPRRGPQVELQAVGDGISASGADLWVLPEGGESFTVRLRWSLPRGQEGVSSFGEGDTTSTVSRRSLLAAFFLAGHLYRYSGTPADRFQVYGLGRPDYDLDALFHWAEQWRRATLAELPGASERPLRIFFRSFDGGLPSASGYTPEGDVMLYLPPRASADRVWSTRLVIAHEMMHAWTHGFDEGAQGAGWYDEGMADYLAVVLPYRAGLYTPREFQDLVNGRAATYYGNARRDLPEEQVENAMWSGADAWTTHYMRGFMYLADLDAKLRSRQGGRVRVLTLIEAIRARRARGESADLPAWRALVGEYGGDEAVRDLDGMLAGRPIFPGAGAFGACLEPRSTTIGVFGMGYQAVADAGHGQVVSRVDAGSPAARAGLAVGDVILDKPDASAVFSQPHGMLNLRIRRDRQERLVSFLPRDGETTAIEWVPASGNPDAPCPAGATIAKNLFTIPS